MTNIKMMTPTVMNRHLLLRSFLVATGRPPGVVATVVVSGAGVAVSTLLRFDV